MIKCTRYLEQQHLQGIVEKYWGTFLHVVFIFQTVPDPPFHNFGALKSVSPSS